MTKIPMTPVDPMEVQVADMQRHLQAVGQIVRLDLWKGATLEGQQHRFALKKRLTELREAVNTALSFKELNVEVTEKMNAAREKKP